MNRIQTKNSIKKLVIENLCRLFGEQFFFTGSLCDVIYVGLPLEKMRDIDFKAPLSNRSKILTTILNSEFYIYNQSKKRFSVRPYKTYEPIRNFGIHITTYQSENIKSFKYAYHLHILGICLDISFYYDDDSITIPITKIGKMNLQTLENRKSCLNIYAKDFGLHPRTQEKHLSKLPLYEYIRKQNLDNPLDKIDSYVLPNEFDPIVYKQKNMHDLYKLTTKDALIDHYVAHGLFENRMI